MPKKQSRSGEQFLRKLLTSREQFSARIDRKWKDLPNDAVISTHYLIHLTGIHPKTLSRHAAAGRLTNASYVRKIEAEGYLRELDRRGGVKPGRPRKDAK